ncbi:MAG: integrase core domain-containing protein [Candidatus Liptonbacteria bacterium]
MKYVRKGHSTREAAVHFGYSQAAIVQWMKRAPSDLRARIIPTRSSRPYRHPRELGEDLVRTIIEYRMKYERDAFFLHHMLQRDGYEVSLSSVKRTLHRNELTRFSKWKKWHIYPPRPIPEKPGVLVEIDTVHDGIGKEVLYLYTMLDVCSRWAYALPSPRISTWKSLGFVREARILLPFPITTLQSDHGSEFSKWFTKMVEHDGVAHRHSRIRKPNDNAHLERFNRTIQDECLRRIPKSLGSYRKEIPEYLRYYNTERPHMGLDMKTPLEVITSY